MTDSTRPLPPDVSLVAETTREKNLREIREARDKRRASIPKYAKKQAAE